MTVTRRDFLRTAVATGATLATVDPFETLLAQEKGRFGISLAEWSLHRTLRAGTITNLDFPRVAKDEFGITALEYVNQFFKDQARDMAYLKDLKSRTETLGVKNVLIMVDGEGMLGHPEDAERARTVDNHKKWVEAAKFLGCHAIRVNAQSKGTRDEQERLAADGLRSLGEFAAPHQDRRHRRESRRPVERRVVAGGGHHACEPAQRRHLARLRQLPREP